MRIIQPGKLGALLLMLVCLLGCKTSQTTPPSEQQKAIAARLESRDYTIAVDRMFPQNGRSRSLTGTYAVTIKGDSIYSHLPYFGKAYSVPYGGGEGLNFKAPVTVYTLTYDAKGTAHISAEARTNEDRYRYRISVFTNGSSSIQVTSNNRQAISYQGNLEQPKP